MAKVVSRFDITSFDNSWGENPVDGKPQSGQQVREFLGRKHKELAQSTSIADAWTPSTPYVVGEVVMYNNKRYKCTSAHTSGTTFDSTKWTEESVQEELDVLNGQINGITTISEEVQIPSYPISGVPTINKYCNTINAVVGEDCAYLFNATGGSETGTANANYLIEAGETYRIYANPSDIYHAIVIADEAFICKYKIFGHNYQDQPYEFTADEDGFMLVNYPNSVSENIFDDEHNKVVKLIAEQTSGIIGDINKLNSDVENMGVQVDDLEDTVSANIITIAPNTQNGGVNILAGGVVLDNGNVVTQNDFINQLYATRNTPITLTLESGIISKYGEIASVSTSRCKHASISITEGEKYKVTCYSSNSDYCGAILYNSSTGSYHVLLGGNHIGYVNEVVVIPSGYDTMYLNTAYQSTTHPLAATKVVTYPIIPKLEEDVTQNTEDIASIMSSYGRLLPLKGKKIVCLGDSITDFSNGDGKGYVEYLAELTSATVIRGGIAGTRLRQRRTPTATPTSDTEAYAGLDIQHLAWAWANDDWTIVDACNVYLDSAKTGIINNLKNNLISVVDVVTIFAGTNDFMGGVSLNNIQNALSDIVITLLTANPKLKIYVFTPIVRYIENLRDEEHWSDNYVKAETNIKLPDVVERIEQTAKSKHIPVCNFYWNLGWNQVNFSNYFIDTDGTHPYKGFAYIADKIKSFIYSN